MHLLLPLLLSAAIQVTSPTWADAPASMPPGTKMAVLEGSPKEAGLFTIRLKLPAGASIATHTHPRPERVTVLSGHVILFIGDKEMSFTKGDLTVVLGGQETTFTAGGFYINPPDVPHSLSFREETVLQLTCEGPWELRYLKPEPRRD